MSKLGAFGAAVREAEQETGAEPDTFELWGREFRLAPKLGAVPIMLLAKAAQQGADTLDADGTVAVLDWFLACLHPDDRFAAKRFTIDLAVDADDLARAAEAMTAVMLDRPTPPSSDSSDGRPSTSKSSNGSASTRGKRSLPAGS